MLHLQLKHYEYDIQCDAMVKVRIPSLASSSVGSNLTPKMNDPFEFPLEIDLDEFLDGTADRAEPWTYKLYGVLVHSGDAHSGHNFALIKPDRWLTWWLKFDDERVTPVTDRELLKNCCGGRPDSITPHARMNRPTAMKRFTNPSVLVYMRKAAIGDIMAPFNEGNIPPHLSEWASCWWSCICGSSLF